MLCQMSRSLAHSSERPPPGERREDMQPRGWEAGRRSWAGTTTRPPASGSTWAPFPDDLSRPKPLGKLRGPSVVSLASRELPQISETQPSQQQLSPQSELQEGGERGLASY